MDRSQELKREKEDRRDAGTGAGCLSLYIHIPFCVRKCSYCDFLSGPQDEQTRERYVESLIREICMYGDNSREVDTIFLGGGTPSILAGDQIRRIMQAVFDSFSVRKDAEISMELNPGTADRKKLQAIRRAGINRLSMGVQSMHDEELRMLGRIHSHAQAVETFKAAREEGFGNINIDLMSALPGQTFESWARTLEEAAAWGPEHISAYSLIIEPGTPFDEWQDKGMLPPLPDEETDREMYHYTRSFLQGRGYDRYEISNYARPGRECRHNTGYWTGHDYLGMGIGAASYVDGTRFTNTEDIQQYMDFFELNQDRRDYLELNKEKIESGAGSLAGPGIRRDVHRLETEEKMEEFMFLGLRMTGGVSPEDFKTRFGRPLDEVYGEMIRKHESQGLVERTDEGIRLTERGTDISNYVLADYLF